MGHRQIVFAYKKFQGGTAFVDHLCYLCLVFFMLSRLFIATLWSPAGKGLSSWWYLIVSIPDLCRLSHFKKMNEIEIYDLNIP